MRFWAPSESRYPMLHRGMRFVHAAVLAFSAALAFMFVRSLDESEPLGNSALIYVLDTDNSVDSTKIIESISAFSETHDIAVAREVSDLRDPDGLRHLYVTAGSST